MSSTLREYADALNTVTGFTAGDSGKVYRQYNAVLNLSVLFFVADYEPTRVLPLNVIWLNMNKESDDYMKFMRRISKVASGGYNNTWEQVTEYNSLFALQYYDVSDGTPSVADVSKATTDDYGLVKLSYDAAVESAPKLVSTTDPRLSDDRYPNDHEHDEKPMVSVIGVVDVSAGSPTESATLVAESGTNATQRQLKISEIED